MTGAFSLTGRVVAPDRLSPTEMAVWERLQADHPELATAFLSHPYALAASSVFQKVRVCVIEQGGEPVGFFPFQYAGARQRALGWGERIGGELSDFFGVVAPSGIGLNPQSLLRLAGLTTLNFTHLESGQGARGLTGEQPEPGLRIAFPQGSAVYWQELRQRDKRFVADTERCARRLVEAKGPLRFVFQEANPLPHLEHLIAVKRDQYRRTGVGDPLADQAATRFLARLAMLDHPSCRGVLSTLRAGEEWVASHFGLMHGNVLHYWFPIYNPDLRAFSPGRLLLKELIFSSPETGLAHIDCGAGDTPAKRDFANTAQVYTRGLWQVPSARALACRLALSVQWRRQARRRALSAAAGEPGAAAAGPASTSP